MAYTVFESTNMGTTHYDGKIFDAIAATDIENGTFGYIDGLADDCDVIYNFKVGTKEGASVFVVDEPVANDDTSRRVNQRKDKFIVKAGTPFRIREVKKNDKFSITIDGVTSATQEDMEVGAYVTIDSTTGKLVASDEATEGVAFEGIVEGKRIQGGTLVTTAHTYGHSATFYKVRVSTLTDYVAPTSQA